jgi:hypothetical protein
VLYVATVHWRDSRWIEPQRRYLERNIEQPFAVFGDLEGIPASERRAFDHVSALAATRSFPNPIFSHTEKLNELARVIDRVAAVDDALVFLDGDAFPIEPLDSFLEEALARRPLLAIRRDENLGDPQPHPSFCATTVGFWRDLGGDWNPGHRWTNAAGQEVTDAGGNLLRALHEHEVDWQPLRRTNRRNIHPLWFGVYGDLVYHHGSGFRGGLCRRDREVIGRVPEPPPDPAPGAPRRERLSWELRARKWYWLEKRPVVRRERRALARNRRLSESVYQQLLVDERFWLRV